MTKNKFKIKILSSLAKVFPDKGLVDSSIQEGSALWNETYSFQVAYQMKGPLTEEIRVDIESSLSEVISIKAVGLVPSEFPIYHDHDENVLRTTPGLYPDPLYDVGEEGLPAFPNQWRSIWVSVEVTNQFKPGKHPIHIRLKDHEENVLASELFTLKIIPVTLPKQKLIHTEWLHVDSLAAQYGVPVFSEGNWEMIDRYVRVAVKHGINMIYTPLFTPPLDTAFGEERSTVQLVDVKKEDKKYHFTFDKLKRWVNLCLKSDVEYLEFSHLFTQGGAKHAPKIMATENGIEKRIFGWETDATGEEYKDFIAQFLPALIDFIKEHELEDMAYFHVSDEPTMEDIESYASASKLVNHYLSDFPVIDALYEFGIYERGLVRNPIPTTNLIEPFLEADVPNLWTYHCCGQYKEVGNRFFCFPSSRNRILGLQLYKFDIKGFLQWGYNYWFSKLSRKAINPFSHTHAGNFPSGDAFIVYPGEDGPIESLRLKVFYDALQDIRALELLETYIGKDHVVALLEKDLDQEITFKEYPLDSEWLLNKREEINQMILEHSD